MLDVNEREELVDIDVDLLTVNDVEMDNDGDPVTDKLAVCVLETDSDGDDDIDCTGPVYSSIKAVFVDVYQKTLRGGLAVDVVYKDPAIGVNPPPKI